jgi:hypothetical protein
MRRFSGWRRLAPRRRSGRVADPQQANGAASGKDNAARAGRH